MNFSRMYKTISIALFLSIIFRATDVIAQFPLFIDGDRVCFIGNSITMNGRFHNYIELYYVTRFPDKKIKFYNCGISGDVTSGILRRLDTDILGNKPTWSVLMIGMNDVNRGLYAKEREAEEGIKQKQQDALSRYFANVDSIVRILLKAESKVILQTPSIYDQTADLTTPNLYGVNDALKQCAEYLKRLASKYDLPVVDYWTMMNNINKKIQKSDPHATIVGTDRVHPDMTGHFLMTYEFLKTQQAPEYVSIISIDGKKHKVMKAWQCDISEIRYNGFDITFASKEASLPYPRLSKTSNPDSLVSFTNDLNKQIIRIKSLKKGNYLLTIDSVVIGKYSEKDLKAGVNLANNSLTPQYQQSEKVLKLLSQYWEVKTLLRQIKYVEHGLMGGVMKDTQGSNDELSDLFEKRLETFKGQSQGNIDFYKRHFNEYLVNKPMETELLIKFEQTFKEIQLNNKPVKHNYQISKAD